MAASSTIVSTSTTPSIDGDDLARTYEHDITRVDRSTGTSVQVSPSRRCAFAAPARAGRSARIARDGTPKLPARCHRRASGPRRRRRGTRRSPARSPSPAVRSRRRRNHRAQARDRAGQRDEHDGDGSCPDRVARPGRTKCVQQRSNRYSRGAHRGGRAGPGRRLAQAASDQAARPCGGGEALVAGLAAAPG